MSTKAFVLASRFTPGFRPPSGASIIFELAIVRPDGSMVSPTIDSPGGIQGFAQILPGSTLASLRHAQEQYVTTNWVAFGLDPADLSGLTFVYLDDKGIL